MTALELQIKIAGLLLLILALSHHAIVERFHWREEAQQLSLLLRQVIMVHTFFIALIVGLMGALMVFWTQALTTPSALGAPITGGLAIFWLIRLYCQWFVYERALWRGKRFETTFHYLFSFLWVYLVVLFGKCFMLQIA